MESWPRPPPGLRLPVQLMALVTIITYVLAGMAKLRNGGMDWLVGDVLRNQVAFDNLRKELLGAWHSPFGGWAVRYAWIFPPMAVATVVVELGAPVAFLGGRWRTIWACERVGVPHRHRAADVDQLPVPLAGTGICAPVPRGADPGCAAPAVSG